MTDVREIVARRWPEVARWIAAAPSIEVGFAEDALQPTLVADGIQLWSAFGAEREAELLSQLVPEDAKRACLYGISHAALAQKLLDRPALESLRVVVLNASVAAAVLEHAGPKWLADPRVELISGAEPRELEVPFAVAPGEIRLATAETARLVDLVQLELRTPHARRHQRAQIEQLTRHIDGNRHHLASDDDVDVLAGTTPEATLRVAAAGPTLSTHFDRLRATDDPLIAVDAALQPLLRAGIRPDLVLTIDPHVDGMRRVFELPDLDVSGITLVYLPVVLPEVVAAWPGRRVAAYGQDAVYDAVASELPHTGLWTSGSVLHPAVDLACRMGAKRVELYGADFANVGGRTHVAGAAWETRAASTSIVFNADGDPVPSQPNLIGYLRDLERFIARHPHVQFVNAGRAGAAIAGTVPLEECHVR